jgi:hypothetical protein
MQPMRERGQVLQEYAIDGGPPNVLNEHRCSMRADELRALLDRRPFEPIRLYTSAGQYVDIKHPEMAIVSRSLVAAGVPGDGKVADYIVHYNLLHIVKIEPLIQEVTQET